MTAPTSNPNGPSRTAAISSAAASLAGMGLTIFDRDWHHDDGVLDIVAADNGVLVACVLQTRTRHGRPRDLSPARLRLARGLAARWMSEHGTRYERIRIDLISYVSDGPGGCTIEHVRGVA
jgi:Holliday junction resolvase-like predicted endonuclease